MGNPTVAWVQLLGNKKVSEAREETFDICSLYIGVQTRLFLPRLPLPQLLLPRAPTPGLQSPPAPIMSGSSRQGRWVASSIMEEDIAKLRAAWYLTAEIHHQLPAEGQVIPTPRSGERAVFVSHFLRGLGFALNPSSEDSCIITG